MTTLSINFSPYFAGEEGEAQNGYVGIGGRAGVRSEAVWPPKDAARGLLQLGSSFSSSFSREAALALQLERLIWDFSDNQAFAEHSMSVIFMYLTCNIFTMHLYVFI